MAAWAAAAPAPIRSASCNKDEARHILTSDRPKRSETKCGYSSRSGEDGGRSSADACREDSDLLAVLVDPLPELLAEVGLVFLGEIVSVLAIGCSRPNH